MAALGSVLEVSNLISALKTLVTNAPEQNKLIKLQDFESLLSRNLDALTKEEVYITLVKELGSPSVLKTELDQVRCRKRDGNVAENSIAHNFKFDIRWKFVKVCSELLKLLKQSLAPTENRRKVIDAQTPNATSTRSGTPSLDPKDLSVSDQKVVSTCFQFIVFLGICPNLFPGVGVPLEMRSGFGNLLRINNSASRNEKHLYDCIKTMVTCIHQPALGSLVLSRHLGDVLAGLLQILHAPTSSYGVVNTGSFDRCLNRTKITTEKCQEKEESACDETLKIKPCSSEEISFTARISNPSEAVDFHNSENIADQTSLDQEARDYSMMFISDQEREECREILQLLLHRVYPPLIVRELLVLQGGRGKRTHTKLQGSAGKYDQDSAKNLSGSEKRPQVKRTSLMNTAPKWLQQVCGLMLSELLMKSNGLQAVLKGILELGPSSSSDSLDWQKCDAVARIIASCPSQAASVEDYYSKVCPQVINLFHGQQFTRVAIRTILLMLEQYPELADKYILKPIMAPLVQVTEHSEFDQDNSLIVDEASLAQAVEYTHKVFVASSDAVHVKLVMEKLAAIIHPLFELFCFTRRGISHLRSAAQEIVTQYLKQLDAASAMKALFTLAFRKHPSREFGTSDSSEGAQSNQQKEMHIKLMSEDFTFANGNGGGVVIKYQSGESEDSPGCGDEDILAYLTGVGESPQETRALCIVELLMPLKTQQLAGDFFLYLMEKLTNFISGNEETYQKKGESTNEHLLGGYAKEDFERNIIILNLLALMCEKLGPSILKSTHDMLVFVKATLDRGCLMRQQEQLVCDPFLTETLSMALGMLTAILGGAVEVDSKDRQALQALVPLLETLANQHPSTEVQQMANDLRIAIITHGAVWSQKMKEAADSFSNQQPSTPRNNEKDTDKCTGQSEFEKVFKNLADPLLPVRGFAMVRIAALLYAKDKEAIESADTLLKIFEQQLTHDDSYIYLAAIKGLVALANVRTQEVISRLTQELTSSRVELAPHLQKEAESKIKEKGLYEMKVEKVKEKPMHQTRSVELRLKVVEALVKVTQDCGEMLPKYSQLLISTLLSGIHDSEALVRASCLSNLGDVCRLLRFSVGPIVYEVFNCLSCVLKSDKSEHVRRAAVNVMTLLFKGLGKDSLKVLDSVLKEVYRLLKSVEDTDPDELTRVHAQTALGELDTIMRGFLFPKPSLTKRIQVLP